MPSKVPFPCFSAFKCWWSGWAPWKLTSDVDADSHSREPSLCPGSCVHELWSRGFYLAQKVYKLPYACPHRIPPTKLFGSVLDFKCVLQRAEVELKGCSQTSGDWKLLWTPEQRINTLVLRHVHLIAPLSIFMILGKERWSSAWITLPSQSSPPKTKEATDDAGWLRPWSL